MSALVHCIYTSVQARSLSDADLARLVKESRLKNASRGLTGILLHVESTFFQVLEGPPEVIDALYDAILCDPRHTRITRIIYEPIARRYFADSSMTLAMLSPAQLQEILHDDDPRVREDLLAGLDEGRAKRLLRAFTDGRWRGQIGLTPPATTSNLVRA